MENLRSELTTKLDQLSETVNQWATKFTQMDTTINELKISTEKLTKENENLNSNFMRAHDQLDAIEQRSRMCNIEIQNLPERKGENLIHIVETLGSVLGVPIDNHLIRDVHRVASNKKTDRPKNIIVQLATRRLRAEVVAAARTRRELTVGKLLQAAGLRIDDQVSDEMSKIVYVNQHLTLRNKILHSKARAMKKELNYKFVWIQEGSILMRKSDSSKIIPIRSDDDILKLKK